MENYEIILKSSSDRADLRTSRLVSAIVDPAPAVSHSVFRTLCVVARTLALLSIRAGSALCLA